MGGKKNVILTKVRINQNIKVPFLALLNEGMRVCFSSLPWGEDWVRDANADRGELRLVS
jgi:hypothetical protein